jgi:xylulokinase
VAGGARSEVWCQLKADILGCNYCTINREDISILGQALIAAAAAGAVSDVREAAERIVTVEKVYTPDEEKHGVYAECVKRYREMLDRYNN